MVSSEEGVSLGPQTPDVEGVGHAGTRLVSLDCGVITCHMQSLVTLAARMLYFGENTRYSGLSIRLLISLIFFWLFLSNTLIQ